MEVLCVKGLTRMGVYPAGMVVCAMVLRYISYPDWDLGLTNWSSGPGGYSHITNIAASPGQSGAYNMEKNLTIGSHNDLLIL